ncbi:hypothetical protein [Pinibacter soli]|uniref:DUF3810 domain-containing protein n=1 Tax=Pinibacter soli TaxID=3044211 RepID=A0ABT6R9R9_9BACT|nr:hypothetical protein [Pinibacter soli]MDI3319301.1 hypothetical protein [Pinibacter soli]
MLKKSLKYLLIILINFLILNLLLLWWTDDIELITGWARPVEFLKLSGFSLLACVLLRLLVVYFRRKNIQPVSKRLKIAAIVTILLSSYFYVHYFSKIRTNRFLNGQVRDSAAKKVRLSSKMVSGYKADNLTIQEYNELIKATWFPSLPKEATAIQLSYDYYIFPPDYVFSLSYDLPPTIKIDTFTYHDKNFEKSQHTYIESNVQKVDFEQMLY